MPVQCPRVRPSAHMMSALPLRLLLTAAPAAAQRVQVSDDGLASDTGFPCRTAHTAMDAVTAERELTGVRFALDTRS